MYLHDFIKKYSKESFRAYVEYTFRCEFNEDEGFVLPEGFTIINAISRIPLFIIAVNRHEKALISYECENGEHGFSLSIYDSELSMDVAIENYEKYYQEKYDRFNFRRFCESTSKINFQQILGAIEKEIYELQREQEKTKEKDIYIEDLKTLVMLFMGRSLSKNQIRVNYIRDAYPLLRKLKCRLVPLENLKLIRIADVYFTETDETFYVLKKDYIYSNKYITDNIEQTRELLINDGWSPCGKIDSYDDTVADMLNKGKEYIAIWET